MASRKSKTEHPYMLKTSHYDEGKASRAVAFIESLKHTKGQWAGQPFKLMDWQRSIIEDLFGTVKANGYRQFTTAYIEIPKKCGKSELAAAVALYLTCADGEQSAEVYGCANDRQQASIVFDVAAQMVRMCPPLLKRCKVLDATKTIKYLPTNSAYKVLSSEAYSKHGFNVSGMVYDELHAAPDRRLFDVMTKGSGDARTQPLYFLITTAGNDIHSVCYEQHQKAADIIAGRKSDYTFYPVIYGADMSDDWTDPKVWKKANPSLGVTVTIDKIKEQCESAKQNPAEENLFRQLRLDQWVKQAVRWMPMEKWDACKGEIDTDALTGRTCYIGLDLSRTTDLTAAVEVFTPADDEDRYTVIPHFWIPAEAIERRSLKDHVPYDLWQRQGYVDATDGAVVDYQQVRQWLNEQATQYDVREIDYDPWNANTLAQELLEDGANMVEMRQGYVTMSGPTKELMNLVLQKRILHDGHPTLRWCLDNASVRTDPAGNIKLDKERSTERIDGAVALVMGLGRALLMGSEPEHSVYEERGVRYL